MKKYLCFLITALILITNISGVFAFEYAPYIGDGIIKTTSVVFTDVDGNVVTTPVPGQVITATVRVKAGTESLTGTEKTSLVLASYSKGMIKEIKVDTKNVANATVMSQSITVPDVEPGIRVFMWDEVDGLANARPLNKMGIVSEEASEIEQISVGGILIEGFSPDVYEYDVTVNAGYVSWPEIIAYTSNTATKVDATYEGNFPLSAPYRQKVDATAEVQGTSETAVATIKVGDKEYKINITQEIPQITDVRLTYQKSDTKVDEVWPDVKNISVYMSASIGEPAWNDSLPGPNIESDIDISDERKSEYYNFLKDYETSGASPMFAKGVFHYIYNMEPELAGAQQIIVEKDKAKPASGSDDYFEFTIERSARVYAYVGTNASALNETTGWNLYQNLIYPSDQVAVRGAIARYIGSSDDAYSHKLIRPVKYKDFIVEPGEKAVVKIPKGNEVGYTFVKYFESNNVITNASYQYGTKAVTKSESYLFEKPILANKNLTGTDLYLKYKPSTGLTTSLTSDVVANGTGNVLFATSPFSDYPGYVPVTFDERFDNAKTLRMRYDLGSLKFIKFDLTAPAKVYVLTNITSETDFENVKSCLEGWNVMGEGDDSLVSFYNIVNGNELTYKITEKTSFENTYYMDYGETQTVTLDFSDITFPSKKIIMVLVKPIN